LPKKKNSELIFVIFLLINIVIGIIPAALTYTIGLPSAFRSAGALPFISLLAGYVLWKASEKWKYVLFGIVLISTIFSYKLLSHYYFVYPKLSQREFDAPLKNVALATKKKSELVSTNGEEPTFGYQNPWDQFIWKYWDYYSFSRKGLHLRYYLMNYRGETCSESRKDYVMHEKLFFSTFTGEEHNREGIISLQRGRPDKAIKHFSEAIQKNPNYAEAHRNLGAVWSSLGHKQNALNYFTQAYAILLKNPQENPKMLQEMEKIFKKPKTEIQEENIVQ